MGGRRRISSGRRANGKIAAFDRKRKSIGSAAWRHDVNGDLAELYGYVNRSLPDVELDDFVYRLARRIASFDKQAIAETKRLVNIASLPPDSEIAPEWEAFLASLARPAAQTRIEKLMEQGFHKPGDVENRLGHYVGKLGGTS